jgi:DNA-binding beta-propeller fold protein YncE
MTRVLTTAAVCLCLPASGADKLVLVAGGGNGPDGGPAVGAALVSPFSTTFDADGTLYFVEMEKGERLRAVTRDGTVRTVAGTGKKGNDGDGMPGPQASFNGMHSLAAGPDGILYLADTWNNRIRTFDPTTGRVAKFAGDGVKGFGGDGGPADKASFGGVYCLAFDPDRKNLYVADLDTRRVRKIDMATKTATTVAGTGTKGMPKDGETATGQPLIDPRAVAANKDGTIYILERSGHCLRAVDKEGKIHTVAGTGRAGALIGAAKLSQFNGPKHLCVDRDGTVLIADTENHRIVRYDPKAAVVTLVAGTGVAGGAGLDGDPAKAELFQPHGVGVHPKTGEIYICDSGNHRIVKIER